jgi:Holliday junction resolvasome RuvABC ATP-dependent DNA helicase subunit
LKVFKSSSLSVIEYTFPEIEKLSPLFGSRWATETPSCCKRARPASAEIAQFALEALNIDKYGLDEIDNKILCTIIDKFKGGPVGLTTIATALGEDAGTIEEVYEPFLIKEGFLKRTPRGREVTELAYKHLGRSLYSSQRTLFGDE